MSSTPETINLRVRGAAKTRISIEGTNKFIFLNLDDQGIFKRFNEVYADMVKEADRIENVKSLKDGLGEVGDEQTKAYLSEMDKIDTFLREKLDYIFDSPVADACSAGGTMYDINKDTGLQRFELIIADISTLYKGAFESGAAKMIADRERHTKKYTKK